MARIRLQKYFTDCGILSRRKAEEEIRNGQVSVNGEIAHIGDTVEPEEDTVLWRGKLLSAPPQRDRLVLMLNKPRGVLTTLSDDRGRKTVLTLLSDVPTRVYPIGRLDYNSEGLLLLTDDGDLTNRLTHPRHGVTKTYHVTVAGKVEPKTLRILNEPMTVDGYRLLPVPCSVLDVTPKSTTLEMILSEGRNRQIRKMCEQVGLRVLSLRRIAIGKLTLGDLPAGKWRRLTEAEIALLTPEEEPEHV